MRTAVRNDYFVRSFLIGRWVNVDDLVGTNEIADRLDYSRGKYIWQMYKDPKRNVGFPAPVTIISGVYIWMWPDVEAWAVATGKERRLERWRELRSTDRP